MAKRKWTGKITEDLTNGYGSTIKKGTEVICWKKRMLERNINDKLTFQGKYEYHYTTSDGHLVRTTKFLIEGQTGCDIIKNQ